ncbi:hypothetical protein PFISCL1PPCAC_19340, partial [Pristionchus fissidentatus]
LDFGRLSPMSDASPVNSPNVSERRKKRKKKEKEEDRTPFFQAAIHKLGLSEKRKKKKKISPARTPGKATTPVPQRESRERTERENRTTKEKRIPANLRPTSGESGGVRKKKSRNEPSLLVVKKKEEEGHVEDTVEQEENHKEEEVEVATPLKRTPEKDKHNHSRPILEGRDPEYPTVLQMNKYLEYVEMIRNSGLQGLVDEYNSVKGYRFEPISNFDQLRNVEKNRYKDIVCLDHSRVILNDNEGKGDYIHANYIRGIPFVNEFLCTQGPLQHTIADFWRMAWEHNVGYIVMLCELVEQGKKKCERYIPEKKGEFLEFGEFRVTTLIVKQEDHLLHTELLVEKLGATDKNLKKFYHWQWRGWPDRGVPFSTAPMLRILREIRGSRFKSIVHCSAGVGRTGTLVAVEYVLQSIMQNQTVNMKEALKHIRNQRAHAIQTAAQYAYIAMAVLRQFAIVCKNSPETVTMYGHFNSELQQYVNQQGGTPG